MSRASLPLYRCPPGTARPCRVAGRRAAGASVVVTYRVQGDPRTYSQIFPGPRAAEAPAPGARGTLALADDGGYRFTPAGQGGGSDGG